MTGHPPKSGGVFIYLIAFIAAAGGFNFGYDIVLMSGAMLYIENYFNVVNPDLYGFSMSSASYGMIASLSVGGWFANRLGRRQTLLWAAALLIVSALGTTFPNTLFTWNLFRVIGGLGGGLAALVSPMYIAEIAPANRRGLLVTINQLAIVLGAFLSNIVCWAVARRLGSDPECWRWMFGSAMIPLSIFLVGLFFIPCSPRWLVLKNRIDEARAVLARIGGTAHADQELAEIQDTLREQRGSFWELFGPKIRLALLIAVGLAAFQQLVGTTALVFYAPKIFVEGGIVSSEGAIGYTVIIRIWDIFWTCFAIYTVDKLGRRPLLLVGILGILLGQIMMGVNFIVGASPIYILVAFFIAMGAYDISLAPLAWLIMSEVFPNRLRAIGMAFSAFLLQLVSLAINQVFKRLLDTSTEWLGNPSGVFWLFAGFCSLSFLFAYYFVPETKGRSLEEIAGFWKSRKREPVPVESTAR